MAISFGDSRTIHNEWQPLLTASLQSQVPSFAFGPAVPVTPFVPGLLAEGGQPLTYLAAQIDGWLAQISGEPYVQSAMRYVLVNATVNSFGGDDSSTWEANLAYIVDAFHAKWPGARVYIAKPWEAGQDVDAALLATKVDSVLSTRAWASVGHDESVWFKGGDNGVSLSVDGLGVHYNAAGNAECAAQWKAILGY